VNNTFSNNNKPTNQPNQDKVNTVVLFSNSGDDALSVLRVLGPAKTLGLKVIRGANNGSVQIEHISEGDIVVLQRDFSRDLDLYEKIIKLAHDQTKPVVMDLDDLLLELPENHPDRISNFFTESLLPMLQAIMEVDLVTVATHALQNYLLQYNKNVVVFQNYLNDQLWKIIEPLTNRSSDGHITIGYMGGHSHKPDILMVSPILLKLLHKYSDNIVFKFWGIEPPDELVHFSQVDWCPPKSYTYHDFASYFQTQNADIMIAPLVDNLFNSCKSPIKYLEYSALGVPGVYSKLTPYESVVKHGVDGFLASTPIEWEETLSKLIEDQDLRKRIALNAQRKIHKSWLLSQNAHILKQFYEELAISFPTQAHQLSPYHTLVKSLTRQIFDDNQHKNQQLIDSTNMIGNLHNEIAQINDLGEQKNKQIDQLNKQLVLLNIRVDQLKDQIGYLNDQREQLDNQILKLNTQITHDKQIYISKKLNTNEVKQLEQLYEHIAQLDKIIEHSKEKNIVFNQQISQFMKQIEHLNEQNAILNGQIDQFGRQIDKLKADNVYLYSHIDQINSQKAQLKNQVDQFNKQIEQISEQRAHFEKQLIEREEEVLSYALSTSWQITRPLRNASKKVKKVT
jgi:processive 1,2-diacylglycerol beta-glucosyltransferase